MLVARIVFVLIASGCGPENQAPVLAAVPDTTVEVGNVFEVQLEATDLDGDTLTFELSEAPSGARLTNQRLDWTPREEHQGANLFQVSVRDDGDPALRDVVSFVVTVVPPPNRPPVAGGVDVQQVVVGTELTLALNAEDPDGDELTWTSTGLPAEALLTPGGDFSWTPLTGDVGEIHIDFTVTDDGEPPLSDDLTVSVVVSAIGAFDLGARAVYASDPSTPIPEGACADLIDPTPMIAGDDALLLASTTVGSDGAVVFDNVKVRPPLGLHLQLYDCAGAPEEAIGLPTTNVILPNVYADAPPVPAIELYGIGAAFLDELIRSASLVGYDGDLTAGHFILGFTLSTADPVIPMGGITVECPHCPDGATYYVDADDSDGLFSAGGIPNAATVSGIGMSLVVGATIAQYTATDPSGTWSFAPIIVAPVADEATVVSFIAK